jgi:glycogen phosphorylase
MSNPIDTARPAEASGPDALVELALDLQWSFNHSADAIWERLDPELWAITHNPWLVLQTVSRERLQSVTGSPGFQRRLNDIVREQREADQASRWFQHAHADSPLTAAAYFCMEFMLSEALPIYSGGLGNVAGDLLKTAANLGVPVIGVGLLYQQGYFRQDIDAQGRQQVLYPFNDPGQLPIRPLREPNGEWLRFTLAFPGSPLWVRAWEVRIGSVRLYLLDTNDPANPPTHRGITSELYGGGSELRLKQELVLGIGGWRLLRANGLRPEVCHLNEGHAAFAVLERARTYMTDHGEPFDRALAVTRAGNLFTTHTPVSAGFDRFHPDLMAQYFRGYAERELQIPLSTLLALGRRDPQDEREPFNMAYLAVRGSGAVTAVSRLHRDVSRRIFRDLFPRWPEADVPIDYVTNGVHMPTWHSAEADRIWETACGRDRWRWDMEGVDRCFRTIEDGTLWQLRAESRARLVRDIRERLVRQLAGRGAGSDALAVVAHIFDPAALTIGFARRFAAYKRPDLLLHDQERLIRLLTSPDRPVQVIVAGKAHPSDPAGQAAVERWTAFVQRPEVRAHAVFVSDYDMIVAEQLVRGVDLWINTPRRPWEACGTSGMKVLVNGGLNLSELDGWWAEAYSPAVGWAIGDGQDRGEDPAWDAVEADRLYTLLEQDIVPAFYDRDGRGIPPAWVSLMRESMATLAPRFSANRSVRQYTDEHYLPAAARFHTRAAHRGRLATELVRWEAELAREWPKVAFGELSARREGGRHVFTVPVRLGALDPGSVAVELYADRANGDAPIREPMTRLGERREAANDSSVYLYTGSAPASRPASDYTPRIIPAHRAALVPLEANCVRWYERR